MCYSSRAAHLGTDPAPETPGTAFTENVTANISTSQPGMRESPRVLGASLWFVLVEALDLCSASLGV